MKVKYVWHPDACPVGKTIRDFLANTKDKDTREEWKSRQIHRLKCGMMDCVYEYIGEFGRNFGERFKEYLQAPSPTYDHYNTAGHAASVGSFGIVGRKEQSIIRSIKRSHFIRINDPSLNRNIDKYQVPHTG